MNCHAARELLHDQVDGALPSAESAALESHLAVCPACRAELDSLRALRAATQNLPRAITPARDLWPEIQKEISPRSVGRVALNAPHPLRVPLLLKLAAALVLLAAAFAAWRLLAPSPLSSSISGWQVASLAGAPRIDAQNFTGTSRLAVGQWLETDATSRAQVTVGSIGEVTVAPNSRLRLAAAAPTDHRLELARGRLSALIWAPPRLFFVDTPSATAVDLGCAYTLDVADNGDGTLRVTAGYVALEHAGRESVIPRGAMCLTRRGAGPGTPFAADAPAPLRDALARFDFEHNLAALADILAAARPADAVMLWHLLTRAPAAERGAVFDTLARDHAPPAEVTRAGIVAGSAAMLARWSADLGLPVRP